MLDAVSGYGLDLSSSAPPSSGWPALQIQLLQELVGTSRKMGAHSASTRHMTYLLQHLFPSLSPAEMKDFSSQLSVLAAKSGGQSGGQALSLDRGLVLPPVNLYCLPTVTGVAVSPLTDNMTPFQKQSEKVQGPFLFTPIQNVGAGSARSSFRAKKKTLTWVQGDVAAVSGSGIFLYPTLTLLLLGRAGAAQPAAGGPQGLQPRPPVRRRQFRGLPHLAGAAAGVPAAAGQPGGSAEGHRPAEDPRLHPHRPR